MSKHIATNSLTQHNIKPLGDKLLVEVITDAPLKSPSGIVLPASKKPSFTGRVLAVGNGTVLPNGVHVHVSEAQVGDVVMWGEFCDKQIAGAVSDNGLPLAIVLVGDVLVNMGAQS